MDDWLSVRVDAVSPLAQGIAQFDLRPVQGGELPSYAPGAHIDIELPGKICRSYSLLGGRGATERYQIAVLREPASRGGSAWLHDEARPGTLLRVARPRNHFALDEGEHGNVLIAGGIGVTPLWAMAQRLDELGRDWQMHYRARRRSGAALLQGMARHVEAGRIALSFADEDSPRPDLHAIVRSASPGTHFYCCGPTAMIDAFQQACAGVPAQRVHLERFSADTEPAPGGFAVRLARSGRSLVVPPGSSILDVLRQAGIDVPAACEQGICGACETTVLQGIPDHRDLVLSPAERAANRSLMICCSGAASPELLLDL
ncbi:MULTISPECIES: PDR/VanB family oxidoreductase [Xenophilus]|uniref:PDR/VanB family oxidoreductase n=1 Tax=Xenophilus TaxID=151754 RepID=UPI0005707D33|nr:PDR/VanB family oxidoreductase [Xenophilus azovorans]